MLGVLLLSNYAWKYIRRGGWEGGIYDYACHAHGPLTSNPYNAGTERYTSFRTSIMRFARMIAAMIVITLVLYDTPDLRWGYFGHSWRINVACSAGVLGMQVGEYFK